MKQIYQLFAAATVVVVGATNLAARNWTPGSDAVPADQIKAGQTYALKALQIVIKNAFCKVRLM